MIQQTVNLAFWFVLLAVGGRAVWLARSGKAPLSLGSGMTGVVAAFSVLIVALALDIGYVAPLAIMQDIVAAQQGLQGRPLPTTNLKPFLKAALEDEPVSFSLGAIWPRLGQEEQEEYNSVSKVMSEQAHPPFMTLFVTPFVYFLGVHGTFWTMDLLSIGFFGVALVLLRRGLGLELTPNQKILVVFLFLGWYPMFWVLRAGQSGALLAGLIVIGWYCIRQHRPLWGGVAIGLATSLKLFPGLVLVYFLLRYRLALLSGVVTFVVLNLLAVAFFGVRSYTEYMQTAAYVVNLDSGAPDNCSLFGALYRVSEGLGMSFLASKLVFSGLSLAMVAVLSGVVLLQKNTPGSLGTGYDLEYALFVAAMPLLSPICWSHYFVVLLLPLAVLAKVALRRTTSVWAVSGLPVVFVILALPGPLQDLVPSIAENISWRLSLLLLALPSFALMSIVIGIAKLTRALPVEHNFVQCESKGI